MALPLEYNTVTVTGRYVYLDGTPVRGSVKFTGKVIAVASESQTIIIPSAVNATLDDSGAFSVELPATDDPDIAPGGWTYKVQEVFTAGGGRTFEMDAPLAAGAFDISSVAPTGPGEPGDPTVFVTVAALASAVADAIPGALGGVLETLVPKDTLYVNVEDHGAVGNGTADDTAAIQAAINAGGRTFFPAGTYKITAPLKLGSGSSLVGASTALTTISASHAGPAITTISPGVRRFNLRITSLTISGPGAATVGSVGLDLDSVSSSHVSDVVATGFEKGIRVHSAINGGSVYNRFSNVTGQSSGRGWSLEASGSNANTLDQCRANGNTQYGIVIENSNDNTLNLVQIESNPVGLRVHATGPALADYNSVVSCRFENNPTAWETTANVRYFSMFAPHTFGTYTIADAGVATQHVAIATQATQKFESLYQSANGSFRFVRSANGGTETPALVVSDTAASSGTPVTLQVETARAVGYFMRGTRAGTNYFDVDVNGSIRMSQGGYIELAERAADPAAPVTNSARFYLKDNGAGKTQFCVRFPTGPVQILATEA